MSAQPQYLPNYGTPDVSQAIPRFGIGDKIWSAKPYVLQLATNFTGSVGESQSNQSEVVDFPVIVRGATTELSILDRLQLQEPSRYVFSFTYVPFQSLVYRTTMVQQYNWWAMPYFLQARQPLLAQFINDNGDAAGNVMFWAEKADSYRQHQLTRNSKPFELLISWKYTGVANEVIFAQNQPQDMDLLIFGVTFNGLLNTNTVRFKDLSANYLWSKSLFLWQYFTGLQAQINPILRFPRPVYLPRNTKLEIETQNVASVNATQFLTFYCLTLDQGMTTVQP